MRKCPHLIGVDVEVYGEGGGDDGQEGDEKAHPHLVVEAAPAPIHSRLLYREIFTNTHGDYICHSSHDQPIRET